MYGFHGLNDVFSAYGQGSMYQSTERGIYRTGLAQGELYRAQSGQYGIPIFGVPVAWSFIAGTLATGAALTAGGAYVSTEMAKAEEARHTGGYHTLADGTVITADEMHRRLCQSGVLDPHECERSPSEEAEFWADVPSGFKETLLETMGGSEYRHEVMGDCQEKNPDGTPVDPRCDPGGPKVPPWVWGVAAAAVVGVMFFAPQRDKQ